MKLVGSTGGSFYYAYSMGDTMRKMLIMSYLGRQAFFSAFIGMNGAHLLTLHPELPSTF